MESTQEQGDRHVVLQDSVSSFDQIRGKARHGEAGKVKPYREWVSGDELHRDSGERRRVERVIDHENDRYTEHITDAAGNVVRDVDQPLSEHRGHGGAKRRGFQPGPGAGGL